jgi:hypothetical protein
MNPCYSNRSFEPISLAHSIGNQDALPKKKKMKINMRIAIVIRGIHYVHEANLQTSFEGNRKNFEFTCMNTYRKEGHEIDIFILTYMSKKLENLLETFKPVKTVILPDSEMRLTTRSVWQSQQLWHITATKLIKDYEQENKIQYDLIINTRFDITFPKKFSDMNIDYTKMNILYRYPSGNCDDNLFIFPRSLLDQFTASWIYQFENSKITHEFNRYFPKENIHYMYTFTEEEIAANITDGIFRLTRTKFGNF